MIGTILNVITVLLGGSIGLLFRKYISKRFTDLVMKGIGLCTIAVGIGMALKSDNTLLIIVCVVLGAVLGELLRLEDRLNALGEWAKHKFTKSGEENTFTEALVTSSMVFCIGPMSIMGALMAGTTGDLSLLLSKAMLDCISSMAYSAALGVGTLFSAGVVLVYQGGLTLLAGLLAPLLNDAVIAGMSAVGGVIIIGLGLRILGVLDVKLANFIPAVFLPIGMVPLFALFM